jgi:hypothetical protein
MRTDGGGFSLLDKRRMTPAVGNAIIFVTFIFVMFIFDAFICVLCCSSCALTVADSRCLTYDA